MKYKKENIEKAKEMFARVICNQGLIVDACQNMLTHPELVHISSLEFAKIILNTIEAPKEIAKEKNPYAYKMSELAVEQLFTSGSLSKEPPIKRVK